MTSTGWRTRNPKEEEVGEIEIKKKDVKKSQAKKQAGFRNPVAMLWLYSHLSLLLILANQN